MRHKKLFYVPGLISLLGLPVLLLIMSPEDPPERQNSLHIRLPSDNKPANGMLTFNRYSVYDAIANKKLIQVSMYNEQDQDRIAAKLDFVHREMERLDFTNDTTVVLKVELGDQNSFGDFVWLQNQALIFDIKRYAFTDDAFFFFPNPPPEHYRTEDLYMPAETIDMSAYHFPPPPTAWDIFVRKMGYFMDEALYMIKRNLVLVIGFVLLLFVPSLIGIIRGRRDYRLALDRDGTDF